jgi:hypothetical protein
MINPTTIIEGENIMSQATVYQGFHQINRPVGLFQERVHVAYELMG